MDDPDPDMDLCQLFEFSVRDMMSELIPIYSIKSGIELGRHFSTVPEHFDYHNEPDAIDTLERAKELLSAPKLPAVCEQLLGLYPNGDLDQKIFTEFVDTVILDIEADLESLPLPSYVSSPYYHLRLRSAYPRPERTEHEYQLDLPGSFPEDASQEPPETQHLPELPELPEPQDAVLPPPPPPSSPPLERPHIAPPVWEWEGRETERFFQRGAYVTRPVIKPTYLTERGPREPPNREEIGKIKSILKVRRNHASQRTPKRLGTLRRSPLPARKVAFEAIESPPKRTHLGWDLRMMYTREKFGPEARARLRKEQGREPAPIQRRPPPPEPTLEQRMEAEREEREEADREFEFLASLRRRGFRREQPKRDRAAEHAIAMAKIDALMNEPSELRINDDRKDEIACQVEEAAKKAAEEERRAEEERVRKELEERLARTGGLRLPNQRFVAPVSAEWAARAQHTLQASAGTTLASTGEGTELRRHDLSKVVLPSEWLNDEIVNGSLNWLDRAINSAAGIKDVKKNTRKCLAMSSFFHKRLREQGVKNTQRTLRRYGVERSNLLDVDTVLLPICEQMHWTLLVIRPSKKTVSHMDSLNPRGSAVHTQLALKWMKDILQDKFVAEEWTIVRHEAPLQTNGYDCGVYTITNAMCLGLGLHPIDCYCADDMKDQRIRIASMLLNGGFTGDFDLRVY